MNEKDHQSSLREKEIFFGAIAIADDAQRVSWLETECGADHALRDRVLRLLDSARPDDRFLEPDDSQLGDVVDLAGTSSDLPKGSSESITSFGDYELLGEIARGAMGVVYRARQHSLKRMVAVKMIRGSMFASAGEVSRFRAEAEAAASLNHPNIVPIYEVGEQGNQHYFSMKLFEGGVLSDRMGEIGSDPRKAAGLVARVARAIHAAHQRGLLHRDVKPGNILFDDAGEPHLTDFGLAKQLEGEDRMTISGQIVGTPYYMAPEQAAGESAQLTTATDIYSLGAILYELLTGRPPFDGGTVIETLRRVCDDPLPRPTRDGRRFDRDLETIVTKCLEKDPAQRYASAAALADDLDRWLEGRPIEARPASAVERAMKWVKRRPLHAACAVALAALVLVLAVGGPLVGYRQSQLRQQTERAEAEYRLGLARGLEHATPASVPFIFNALQSKQSPEVRDLLGEMLASPDPVVGRVRAAAALSLLDEPPWEALLDPIGTLPVDEGSYLSIALREHPREAARRLRVRWDNSSSSRERNRLAIFLLELGDPHPAAQQLALAPDLSVRVDFIQQFVPWHGALDGMPELLAATTDLDLRSGLCLAVGGVSPTPLEPQLLERITSALGTLYTTAPDAGTHAAAEWALRQLGADPPEIPPSSAPDGERDWFVNQTGLTMITVPPGVFFPSDYLRMEESGQLPEQAVVLTEPYHLAWATINTVQFDQAIERAVEAGFLPERLRERLPQLHRDEIRPLAAVKIFFAAVYCNALSHLEGLEPVYELDFSRREFTVNPAANGYRLATEAEWEHAARAGTETRFLTGPTVEHLADYAHIYHAKVSAERLSRPNPFGLFDMPGNAWELTLNCGRATIGLQINPQGKIGDECILKGGPTHGGAYFYHASMRLPADAERVKHTVRVARGAPGIPADALSADQLNRLVDTPLGRRSAAKQMLLARAFAKEERWEEAQAAFRRARAMRPDLAEIAAEAEAAAQEAEK